MLFPDCRYLHLLISYAVFSKVGFFRLSDFRMNNLKEQRLGIFCVSYLEKHLLCSTRFGDVMKRAACFKCQERFKGGRQSIEDDKCPGRPSTPTDYPHVDPGVGTSTSGH